MSVLLLATAAYSSTAPLRIDGLVAAVFSPFDSTSNLNISVVPLQQAYLSSTGVEWVFVGGTTGESLSLTKEERKTLISAWLNTNASVIAHCGAEALADARELARYSQVSAK